MNVEQKSLQTRIARLAALADPVRLRIADLLTLGEASPVELQSELGCSSSLLAHHLGILERAGVLTRTRSEADRRRTYLRLIDGAFSGLLPSAVLAARRVVFVCTGNSARSQLAASLWDASSDVPATSAGTHPAENVEDGAIRVAERHGLTLAGARPRGIRDVLRADDLIVTVCDAAHEELARSGQIHWSVADPVADGSVAAFEAAFDEIAARVADLAPRVSARV
ncbi:helix-turn-helix domain-containing protein [Microbacterium sp.]|uniref:arsenate reductase/protein-tyrosine-phosphatase family protein n=1 Tax=Microbacterium sp. TaxID=51671 RepID=UPI000926694D|nr:helix-turn-helix domain-containing protein [Microbacterium sp.]MBN9191628.1 helix-turn-helix domain-containing protein [Microbacterium sp.]OJU67962.1 MAG: ArsR family transcriptional regulator [Microbacterium sp. 70-38]